MWKISEQAMFTFEENFRTGSNEDIVRSHCRVVGYYCGHVDRSGSKDVKYERFVVEIKCFFNHKMLVLLQCSHDVKVT